MGTIEKIISKIIVLVQVVVIWITYSNHKVTTFKEYEPEEIGIGGGLSLASRVLI